MPGKDLEHAAILQSNVHALEIQGSGTTSELAECYYQTIHIAKLHTIAKFLHLRAVACLLCKHLTFSASTLYCPKPAALVWNI